MRAELIAGLARAAGAAGMVGGQCLDLEADKLGLPARPQARARRAPAGHEDGRADPLCLRGRRHPRPRRRRSERRALALYGERLGAAFQIADDLLDAEGDAAAMGKAAGKDAGKATLVSVLGVPAAKARLGRLEAEALAALAPFGPSADILREAARFVVRRQT